MRVRRHGASGARVIVLHGGPGAAGSAGPLARGLADSFRVEEPWQRGSGAVPLSVARHVADLHDLVRSDPAERRPGLVGESWGAMLALAYAVAHPEETGPIVLVGCGTFDPAARARLQRTLDERMDERIRERLRRLEAEGIDPAERLRLRYEAIHPLYDYDPVFEEPGGGEDPPFDEAAHAETWDDMLRLQADGTYPAAFRAITAPVLMIHGAHDPHPGSMIRDGLSRWIPHLEYEELPRCGHRPWAERFARERFFARLRAWLRDRFAETP
ncbi:MAG: alpha/beta fold hydrolase [Candidatus Eisenbacteria bacterium]|nr:alpha/beta fold hydrolase [Candidatus Latescibacterota bacterium]MBD3300981.1 alpha/beta fold hydrolase [Candidatus Eisenbacteria bacterium]